jgi:predicted DNA-binding protein (MmcQ/YjbR family)
MAASPLPRLRRLCLALPEAHEVIAWGEPTFRVRNKMFATFASAANHHGRGRHAAWVKALPVNQDLLVRSAPTRVFVPPYVGPSGWIGLYLDDVADWDEIQRLLREGYLLVAPKRLAAQVGPVANVAPGQVSIKSVSAKRRPRRPAAKGTSR